TCFALALVVLGCTSEEEEPLPPCEQHCQDGIATRALRETAKLIYNLTLQGKPAGEQDARTDCPGGGSARVSGVATSNPVHGATEVDLTYELQYCIHVEYDEDPLENYEMGFLGTLTQTGTLAVQPSATTALLMHSESMSMLGRVGVELLRYSAEGCVVDLVQSGNDLSGQLCERPVGVDLGGQPN
ncbi:MAG TPA: hypothetical protein VGK73_26430, partial [Polyangiaceae bacterium]